MSRTVADLIEDLLAGIHENDVCHAKTVETLESTLRRIGPVIHDGAIAELETGGGVSLSLQRACEEFAAQPKGGYAHYDLELIPGDEVLADTWGLPLAKSFPVPA